MVILHLLYRTSGDFVNYVKGAFFQRSPNCQFFTVFFGGLHKLLVAHIGNNFAYVQKHHAMTACLCPHRCLCPQNVRKFVRGIKKAL